jgi:hypothetical protein
LRRYLATRERVVPRVGGWLQGVVMMVATVVQLLRPERAVVKVMRVKSARMYLRRHPY